MSLEEIRLNINFANVRYICSANCNDLGQRTQQCKEEQKDRAGSISCNCGYFDGRHYGGFGCSIVRLTAAFLGQPRTHQPAV